MILNKKDILFLLKNGYVKIPKLKIKDHYDIKYDGKIYQVDSKPHLNYLKNNQIEKLLAPQLRKIALDNYNVINFNNLQYNVTRKIEPNSSSESYRFHFDSHLFTLIVPVTIPKKSGQLIIFPKIRKYNNNEFLNFLQKAIFKFFSNKCGFFLLKIFFPYKVFDFVDNVPVLFLGYESLHANFPFNDNSKRITFLTHFFDPGSKFSIGNIMRSLRKRG